MAIDHKLSEKCAVFGIYGSEDAARTAYFGLWALQHRGQEGSGIVSSDGQNLHSYANFGLVAHVYTEEDLSELHGSIAIGHNRYATSGETDGDYLQPFLDKDRQFAMAHNGNLPDCSKLIEFLKQNNLYKDDLNDSQMMHVAIGCFMSQGVALPQAIKQAYPLLTGVFSCVAMDKTQLVAFRDECGIRPLSIGQLENGGYVVASETCAFDTIGASYVRDVNPGEIVFIDRDGLHSEQATAPNPKFDIFEFVYFARPDSVIMGKNVSTIRENMGKQMAREFNIEADVVVPVPDSSVPAALGYSQQSGIKFGLGLVKNRYINRTFIQPTDELRKRDVKMKLNPVIDAIKDKRVILVDDSIVRGTTMRQVIEMLKSAGAKEVHLAISSPPIRYPDFYGINTPLQSELIASRMSIDEMCMHLGADSLNFLSIDGMVGTTGLPADSFSLSFFNGVYPVDIGNRATEVTKIADNFDSVNRANNLVESHA
ncbi:amidophosphoribosyltransferase [Candidatus Saccharibacteria bacterium RIFCSPHIGHO2_12_FULL_41_12]|nr:MAG: amidophosphoribosyltransferase [Candidatus Saccharibacteria bacterium RIFCSPHIGHO2_12_FULL_41_12]